MPGGKFAEHVPVVQLIPVGLLVTVPLAADPAGVEAMVTLIVSPALKVADTVVAAFMVTAHAPVPVHAPPQPAKRSLVPAVSASVTCVPAAKFAVQVAGQLIPAGVLVMVPAPVGEAVTVS